MNTGTSRHEQAPRTNRSFLLDLMLGKLTRYLRMCGYDCLYAGDLAITDDRVLIELARLDGRTLISRDVALIEQGCDGVLLTSRNVLDQLSELKSQGIPIDIPDELVRCGRCNGPLEPAPKHVHPPDYVPDEPSTEVYRCRRCGQYFWKGSHVEDVAKRVAEI